MQELELQVAAFARGLERILADPKESSSDRLEAAKCLGALARLSPEAGLLPCLANIDVRVEVEFTRSAEDYRWRSPCAVVLEQGGYAAVPLIRDWCAADDRTSEVLERMGVMLNRIMIAPVANAWLDATILQQGEPQKSRLLRLREALMKTRDK